LQLILNDLQLVDRFLLGSFQTLSSPQLLGGLRGPNLQLAAATTAPVRGNAGVKRAIARLR